MTPITPSGTRTREISTPLGRRHTSTVSPTGSGRAATWRTPAAMSSMRESVRVSRSTKARGSPLTRARARSGRLASTVVPAFSSSARGLRRSASFFTRVVASPSARDASLAARAFTAPSVATSVVMPLLSRLEHHQVVPVDDLADPLVAQRALDVRGLGAADLPQLGRVVVDEPARELSARRLHERDHLARLEIARHLDETGRQQALAPLS